MTQKIIVEGYKQYTIQKEKKIDQVRKGEIEL